MATIGGGSCAGVSSSRSASKGARGDPENENPNMPSSTTSNDFFNSSSSAFGVVNAAASTKGTPRVSSCVTSRA